VTTFNRFFTTLPSAAPVSTANATRMLLRPSKKKSRPAMKAAKAKGFFYYYGRGLF
jgi:hypothetical protein